MSMLHRMASKSRVAPKRKSRRFMPEWPIEIHRQVGEGNVTEKTHFDVMGSDYAHKRWRGGKQQGDVVDLFYESDVEFITGINLVTRIPDLPFEIGEPITENPGTVERIGATAHQGWYVYDKSEGSRYRIVRVDRLPDGRTLISTERVAN